MRKHFLLLFLMALLPLAGWAVDVEVRPFDASVVWTGAKPAQVQTSWITCTPAVDDDVKSAIAAALTIQDLDDYNVGNHTYKLQKLQNSVVVSATTYNLMVSGSYSAELTIEKFEGAPVFTTTDLAFVGGDDLVYTGEAQALLSGGATATANGFPVPVVYTTKATPAETDWVALADLKETNANTTGYTVYYKVVGTDNYAGSAVQTMDGTKAIGKATITFNVSAADGLTYNGAPQALLALTVNNKPATNFGASTLQYKIDDAGEWAELPEAGIAGITGISAKNGVAYSINLKVPADENGNWDETTITAPIATTIAKATPIFNFVPTLANGGLPSGLGYDGQSHQLVLQQATAIVDGTEIQVPVKYAMRRYKNVSKGYTVWQDKTYDQLVGNFASSQYQIRVKTDATDDLNQAIQSLENVAIAKATIPADAYTEPVAKNVRATGAAQNLVDAATWTGETTYGTFQYSLTNNGTDWSTDVPQGTDVAEYTVYWRIYPTVTSDTQNYDIVSGNTTSNITAKSKVTIAIPANQSFGYGTTPTLEYTATWEAQGSDVLKEEGLTWTWYTGATGDTQASKVGGYYPAGEYYVMVGGLAVDGTTAASQEIVYPTDRQKVKITAGQIVANISGTATYGSLPTFTLTHVSGLSETEAAAFNAANNLATVTVKQGTTTVLNDVAKNADGLKALNAGEYTLEATATLANYNVVVSAGTLIVNAKSIADATVIVTTAADDIVYNAKAWGTAAGNEIAFTVTETSGITANDYDVAYTNNVNASGTTDATKAKITLTGKNNYQGTKNVYFTIKKAPLTVKANDLKGEDAWIYGKTEPTDKYSVTVTGYVDGESLGIGGTLEGLTGALNVVRTSSNTVGLHTGALKAQFGTTQPAASKNYAITYETGDLQIAQAALTIKLIDDVIEGTYGDDPAANITAAILTDKANYELDNCVLPVGTLADILDVSGVTFKIDPIANNKYEVNDAGYEFTMTGATTTNYAVTISNGTYKVNPSPIKLQAEDQSINWAADPTATPNTTVSGTTVKVITSGSEPGLQCGDGLGDVIDKINIESTNVGVDNVISLTAKNNKNYSITVLPGVLTVTGATDLAMTSDYDEDDDWFSTIQSYDGKPVTVKLTVNRTQTLLSGKTYTWKGEEWNAFILPFAITPKQLSDAFGYAIVNVVNPSASTADNIAFKLQMSGTIPANTPFMLKNYEAVAPGTEITLGSFEIVAPASKEVSVDAGGGWTFTGTYDKKTINNSNTDVYYYNGEGAWKHLGATSTNTWNIAPFNAYMLQPASSAPAQEVTFTFEDLNGNTTAIKSISEDATGTNAKGWYDLKGMKMENAPTQKGVYIKDGKKVVIK